MTREAMNNSNNKASIEEKLSNVKYYCDTASHIEVDQKKCAECEEKYCTFVCPAGVWEYDEASQKSTIEYENCLECGACRIACPYGAIKWNYPKAGHGIIYKQS